MPRGFTITEEMLAEELRDAKAAGRRDEVNDIDLLITERATKIMGCGPDGKAPTAAQRVDIARARNRQSQRRFQRKIAHAKVRPGDRIGDPFGNPQTDIITIQTVSRHGRCWVLTWTSPDGQQNRGEFTASQVQYFKRHDAPPAPPVDIAGALAASVVVNAARAFLEALDAYVAGEVEAEAYQTYRGELEACLVPGG